MNPAAIHLALNHFPPIVDFAALLVLAIGLFHRNGAIVRAALILFVVASLLAIPVFLTGERSEDVVKDLEGVNAMAIHEHEEGAEWAFGFLIAQGVVSLAALILFRGRDLARWMLAAVIVIALLATSTVFRAAALGGHIHHPETHMTR